MQTGNGKPINETEWSIEITPLGKTLIMLFILGIILFLFKKYVFVNNSKDKKN